MENQTPTELEVKEELVPEPMPNQGTSGVLSKDQAQDIFWLAENIDKIIAAQKKIFYGILKITIPGDFIVFESKGRKTAEINGAGCERISRDIGVSFSNWSPEKESLEVGTDEAGDWFRYKYECDAIWRHRRVRVFGVTGSRTKFFGKDGGELKPLHQVDRNDVQKAARRECMKEGVKVLFGLRHLDPDELEHNGVKLQKVSGHTFKSDAEKAQEAEAVSVIIEKAEIGKQGKNAKGNVWSLYNIYDVEGTKYGTFSKTMYQEALKIIPTKQPTLLTFIKGKYGPELIGINGLKDEQKGE